MAPPKRKQELLPALLPPPDTESDGGETFRAFVYDPHTNKHVNKTGRPRRRPRPTDPGVLEAITDLLLQGHGIHSILKDPNMPSARDFYRELTYNPDGPFARGITRARLAAQQAIMDYCESLARSATPENYNAIKTTLTWFQWHAGKLMPMTYGDKIQLDHRTRGPDVELTREEFTDIAYQVVDSV